MQKLTQTYNDGICNIFEVANIAEPGEMPRNGLKEKVLLRYEERTVGVKRFWTAMQAHARIDVLIRTPQIRSVDIHDVVILANGEQYEIKQIQYPKDVMPPSMDLSLTRLETKFEPGVIKGERFRCIQRHNP